MTAICSSSSKNQSTNNNNNNRVEGTFCLPIVYGSIAFYLGKQAADECTHRWTLYVRGPNGDEDLSCVIRKVIFQLHPSFPQPIREVTSPPFEVTEKGWGEFEAGIRILWNEPSSEQPISITHGIKLYPPIVLPPQTATTPTSTNATAFPLPTPSKEPVISEFYDEIVFTDPTEAFHQQLQRADIMPRLSVTNVDCAPYWTKPSDDNDIKLLISAQNFLDHELIAVKERIIKAEEEKGQLEEQIRAVTAQAQASTALAKAYSQQQTGTTTTTTTATTTTTSTTVPSSIPSVTPQAATFTTSAPTSNNGIAPSTVNNTALSANTNIRSITAVAVGTTPNFKLPSNTLSSNVAGEAVAGKSAPVKVKKVKSAASSTGSGSKRAKAVTSVKQPETNVGVP